MLFYDDNENTRKSILSNEVLKKLRTGFNLR